MSIIRRNIDYLTTVVDGHRAGHGVASVHICEEGTMIHALTVCAGRLKRVILVCHDSSVARFDLQLSNSMARRYARHLTGHVQSGKRPL